MGGHLNGLELSHKFIREHVKPGDFCIDATAGRGRDTVFLASLTGETGRILAFDIQQEALTSTAELLRQEGYHNARLILDSHENMACYAEPDSVSCITFNFGWLPGGDHGVFTRAKSSIAAIESGLTLLRPGGVISLCIYAGRDCGFEERDALLRFLPTLDYHKITVIVSDFVNRPNNPPIPVFIIRDF